jgi:hypothetical protein
MRRIVVGAFLSLDGVMQSPGGPKEDHVGAFQHGGWVVPYFDETVRNSVISRSSACRGDMYDAKFANGRAKIRISLGPDGKLDDANVQVESEGTPGGIVACSDEPTLKSRV